MADDLDINALTEWRAGRDEFSRHHYASPIPEEHLPSFDGLEYFDPDPAFVHTGDFSTAEGRIEIASSTGGSSHYPVAGYVELHFGSVPSRLVVLHAEGDDLFIPFRDTTCGTGSYGGGRYAPVVINGAGEATVDFNRAVNPYRVYDEEFSCPLPPPENWLQIPITAGEMMYDPAT